MAKQKRSAASACESVALQDLPATRERRGVTLQDIAEQTKISIRFLKAIEAGDFKQLPGGIFATSYLRQYAAHVGVRETELMALYERAMSGVAESKTPAMYSEDTSKSTFIRVWWTALAGGR